MHLETNIHKIYIYKSVSIICEIKLVSISTLKNVMFIYIRKGIPIVQTRLFVSLFLVTYDTKGINFIIKK